jgi:hypothetical protein
MEKSEDYYVGSIARPRQDDDENQDDARPLGGGGEGVRGAPRGGLSMEAGAAAMGEHGVENLGDRPRKDQARHLQTQARMTWTAKADAMLMRLWNAGGSLTSVAAAMTKAGFPVTRGAVSGRRMRLGLARPRTFSQPRELRVSRRRIIRTAKRPDERSGEVEYLDLPADGCKAVLEKRGAYGLRMCCGRLRSLDCRGSLSPYCEDHAKQFATPTMIRKPHGESSQIRQY